MCNAICPSFFEGGHNKRYKFKIHTATGTQHHSIINHCACDLPNCRTANKFQRFGGQNEWQGDQHSYFSIPGILFCSTRFSVNFVCRDHFWQIEIDLEFDCLLPLHSSGRTKTQTKSCWLSSCKVIRTMEVLTATNNLYQLPTDLF